MIAGVILLFALNLLWGSVHIPIVEIWNTLFSSEPPNPIWSSILFKSRMPQALTALLAGAALAVGGQLMQTLFRNPLAGPSILGISSGASLGVAVVMLLALPAGTGLLAKMNLWGHLSIVIAALTGSLLVLFVVLFLAKKVKDNTMLLIIGIMMGYLASSLVGVLNFQSQSERVHSYVIWGLGSFAQVGQNRLPYFTWPLIVSILSSLLLVKSLNILMLGEQYARNLGLRIARARLGIIVVTGVLTAIVTAYCGPIAFLGLAVPHLTRMLFKTADHRILLPAVILNGALLALACNLIARLPGTDGSLPVNVVTSIFGAPIVIGVILNKRKLKNLI